MRYRIVIMAKAEMNQHHLFVSSGSHLNLFSIGMLL